MHIAFHSVSKPNDAVTLAGSFWNYFVGRATTDRVSPLVSPNMHAPVAPLRFGGESITLAVPNHLNVNNHTLWLPRKQFQYPPPRWLDLQIGGSHFWEMQEPAQDGEPLSTGFLYSYRPDVQRPDQVYTIQIQAGYVATTIDDTTGYLNPLVVTLDGEQSTNQQIKDELMPFLSQDCLLDVVPDVWADASLWVRSRLHGLMRSKLPADSQWSRVERLLFSSSWPRPETPFLLLDLYQGIFCLAGPGSSDAAGQWHGDDTQDWRDQWLLEWCLKQLKLERSDEHVPEELPRPNFHAELRERRRRNAGQFAAPKWLETLKKLRRLRDEIPASDEQFKREWASIELQGAIYDDLGVGDAEGVVEDLIRAFLRPKSKILGQFPKRIEVLNELGNARWNALVNGRAVELIDSNLYGELAWLSRLLGISPHPHPAEMIDLTRPYWIDDYYELFFTRPPKTCTGWRVETPSALGISRLGDMILGGASTGLPSLDDLKVRAP